MARLALTPSSGSTRLLVNRWFLAGNDGWPRVVHSAARRVRAEQGATVVDECYAPLGSRDFT